MTEKEQKNDVLHDMIGVLHSSLFLHPGRVCSNTQHDEVKKADYCGALRVSSERSKEVNDQPRK